MANASALVDRLACENKPRVKSDVTALLSGTRTLLPSISPFMHYDGTETQNLKLSGTIPMLYRSNQYNVPLDIYINNRHPNIAPSVFVRPTSNMIVKANHPYVDRDGLVHIPYLATWTPAATLSELVQHLSAHFGQDPPLFTNPSGYRDVPVPQPQYSSNVTPVPVQYDNSPVMGTISYGQHLPSTLQGKVIENGGAVVTKSRREKLEDDLTTKLQNELLDIHKKLKAELDVEFLKQKSLSRSSALATETLAEYTKLRTNIDNAIAEVTLKKKQMEGWRVQELEAKCKSDSSASAMVMPYDDISGQLVRLAAEQRAIDDVIYYLEKGKQEGIVDLASFLRDVRKLAKQQFLARMHVLKINASINQALQLQGLK